MNYYNEFDPGAAAWLRELIAREMIPAGHVDQRSISDVQPTDLLGYTQCHFFAGIGGWPLALALAGWPEDEPVWTGSCPCQPFSTAGKQMGRKDPRHLWPTWRRLINRRGPAVVLGEQVASADGRKWLAGVFSNLETMGYAPAGADLCAAGVIAPHTRQRLFWVGSRGMAYADGSEFDGSIGDDNPSGRCRSSDGRRVGNPDDARSQGLDRHGDDGRQPGRLGSVETGPTGPTSRLGGGLADSDGGHASSEREQRSGEQRFFPEGNRGDPWSDSRLILCRDGKHRRIPTEPALFPLADGVPYKLARRGSIRSALLKGAGNAIVPEVAAQFIAAFREARGLSAASHGKPLPAISE